MMFHFRHFRLFLSFSADVKYFIDDVKYIFIVVRNIFVGRQKIFIFFSITSFFRTLFHFSSDDYYFDCSQAFVRGYADFL